jgi:hypothetical protein
MAEAATVLDPPTTLRPGSQSGPQEALCEAHKELARLQAHAAELTQERAQAAEVVERRKAERQQAQADFDNAQAQALAEKAKARPAYLIDAERLLGEATCELDFAQSLLTKGDEALRHCEYLISEATKGLRNLAHAITVEVAEARARELRALEALTHAKRTAFRGLMQAFLTHGVRFGAVSAEMWQMPPPPTYQPERNSIPWRREMQTASEWRDWVERAIRNPDAALPKED